MEVELVLDIDQYEEYDEFLMGKGWLDCAYKRAYLPVVFPGLRLYIKYINPKGEEGQLTFVVEGAAYSFKHRILMVYIKFDESPFLMADIVTEGNGWNKKSVVDS